MSTDGQDLTAQREARAALGVDPQRVYVDHGLTGTNRGVRSRPGSSPTREGKAVAKAKGRLRGKQPKLDRKQGQLLLELWQAGKHTTLDLAELFEVGRSTVYRTIQRADVDPTPAK